VTDPATTAHAGVRVVTAAEAEGLVTQAECNAAVEKAFEELGHKTAASLPRNRLYLPQADPQEYHVHNSVVGSVPHFDTLAVRMDSVNVQFVERPGKKRSMIHPGDYAGFILLFRIGSRELYGIVHDHGLSAMRVAATSAIVSKRMARPGADTIALLGGGQQAAASIAAHQAALPSIAKVRLFTATAERRAGHAERLSASTGLDVEPVSEPGEALRGADIIVSATDSFDATFRGEWIEPGQHITSIVNSDYFVRKSEVDRETVRRADMMVVNSKGYAKADRQPEVMRALREGWFDWDSIIEVGDLVCRQRYGRTSASDITLHFNNGGMGIQFAALGALVVERAAQRGVGTVLPSELFMSRRDPSILSGP
jgi:ornithine cyclodeaminase/alanine dehydrogenase-like protein (mu-crystallin family)